MFINGTGVKKQHHTALLLFFVVVSTPAHSHQQKSPNLFFLFHYSENIHDFGFLGMKIKMTLYSEGKEIHCNKLMQNQATPYIVIPL